MPNQLGVGLPPINTQGVYDILGNSMAGGLGSVYGMQEQDLNMRGKGIENDTSANKLINAYADNPVLQQARDITLGKGNVEKQIIADPNYLETQRQILEATRQKALGEQAQSKIGPQYVERANEMMQINSELQEAQKTGGQMAADHVWRTQAYPFLQKSGKDMSKYGVYSTQFATNFDAMTTSYMQNLLQAQKMAEIQAQVSGQIKGHEIQAASAEKIANMHQGMDQATKQAKDRIDSGRGTREDYELLKSYEQKMTYPGLAAMQGAEYKSPQVNLLELKRTQAIIDAIDNEKDPQKRLKMLNDELERQKNASFQGDTRKTLPKEAQYKSEIIDSYIKKNGFPKNDEELKKIPVSKNDVGKAKINIDGVMYILTSKGWEKEK